MTIKCDDTVDVLNGEHVDGILLISKNGKQVTICETDDGMFEVLNSNYKTIGRIKL